MSEPTLAKVTTFKLTREMAEALNEIAARDGMTKDCAIRKLIRLGLLVDTELRDALPGSARTVAQRIRVSRRRIEHQK